MKVRKVGKNSVVTVPPSKLKLLGWKEGDELDMNVVGNQLVIQRVS